MQVIADFFIDPLILPVYIYLAGYGIAWIVAFWLARVFMTQIGIERATTRAWRIAIITHLIFGTSLLIWTCFRAIPRVAEWWHTIFYVLFYFLILIIDVCMLISIPSQRVKK